MICIVIFPLGLLNRFLWMQQLYPMLEEEILLFKTSISFIDHLQEFLGPILSACKLVIPPFNQLKRNPFHVVDYLKVKLAYWALFQEISHLLFANDTLFAWFKAISSLELILEKWIDKG